MLDSLTGFGEEAASSGRFCGVATGRNGIWMLRITKPRIDVLDVIYRIGGQIHHPEGRAVTQIANALDYRGSLTGLKRVLAALEEHGLITREARGGRVHTITLTPEGRELLRERGLIEDTPRRFLLEEQVCNDRDVLVLAASAIGQQLQSWAGEADVTKPVEELRFEAMLALHGDLEPRIPDTEELAVLAARARVALGNLLDTHVTDADAVDGDLVESTLKVVLEARLPLMAWHKALSGSDDTLD